VTTTRPLLLYVEDDADTLRLAQLRLEEHFEVIGAAGDQEACEFLSTRASELYAVLVDIELKGSSLNGLALVRMLRGTYRGLLPSWAKAVPTLPHLPIVVMTAYITRYAEQEVQALGASHFLTKPIDFTRLSLALAQANIQAVMAQLAAPKK
jgi:CheY-like chemotaxis protein